MRNTHIFGPQTTDIASWSRSKRSPAVNTHKALLCSLIPAEPFWWSTAQLCWSSWGTTPPTVIHRRREGAPCAPSTRWPTRRDSHSFLLCPFKPSESFSSPVNPVSCLPPTLLLNVYAKSVTRPQPFRSFPLFSRRSFSPSSPLSVHCWGDSGADKRGEKISAGVPQDWRERMAERQQRRGRYIDWYEGNVNYRGLPIRGQSDGSVCLAAASQKHHQLPPCLSSAATRPQLPSAITGDGLDTERGLRLASMQAVFADMTNMDKWRAFNHSSAICTDSSSFLAFEKFLLACTVGKKTHMNMNKVKAFSLYRDFRWTFFKIGRCNQMYKGFERKKTNITVKSQ